MTEVAEGPVLRKGGKGGNPNLRISFSVSFQHAKPPSWTSSELLIPPGRLPEGLWRGSSSKSGSNSCGFLLIHWETPAGYLILYISPPSQSLGTSSPPCVSSDLTLAEEALIITQIPVCRKHLNKVRTFRIIRNWLLLLLLFHNKGVGVITLKRPRPPLLSWPHCASPFGETFIAGV